MPKVSFPNLLYCSGKPHISCRSFKSVAGQIFSFLILATVLFLPAVVFAQTDFGLSYGTAIGLGTQDIRETVARIIKIVLGVLGILVTLILIYGGYVWMTSGGNEQKVSMAKKIILNGVIGLLIIILSYALTLWIFKVIIGGSLGGGGNNQCTDGQIRPPCLECQNGVWEYNSFLPTCILPGSEFRVNSINTIHNGNDPARDVYLCSRVQTVFNTKINANSVAEAVSVNPSELRVDTFSGNFSVAGNAMVFKHDEFFASTTSYQLMLPKQTNTHPLLNISLVPLTACDLIVGCNGGGGDPHFIWNFETGVDNDSVAPFITNTYPISEPPVDPRYPNQNVSRSPILEANFSESIDATSVANATGTPLNGVIILERLSGQNGSVDLTIPNDELEVDFSSSGSGFDFYLLDTNLLDAFRWYRITIQGVEDLCGNAMAAPKVWEFQTNDSVPGVKSWYPTGTNQCTDVDIIINFGTSMYYKRVTFLITGSDSSVYNASIIPSLLNPGPYQVPVDGGILFVEDPGDILETHFKSFVFTPTNQWQTNTTYDIEVTTDLVINNSGDTLEKQWSFTTSDPESCACAPYITRLNPNEGMAGQCITVQGRCFMGTANQPAEPTQVTIAGQSTVIGGFGSNYLTTTVPDSLAVGTQAPAVVTITYNNNSLGSITSNNNQTYYVNQPGIYSGPCLWSISPDSGCGSPAVTLKGIRFGADPGTYNTNQNNVTFTTNRQALNPDFTLWNDTTIKTKVPPATIDGDVFVTAGSLATNGVPYDVACGAGGPCSSNPNICDPVNASCTSNICNNFTCLCEGIGGGGNETFRVKDVWPDCDRACMNSALGASFSASVEKDTLVGNIQLLLCEDQICLSGTDQIITYAYNEPGPGIYEVDIYPNSTLLANSQYRVILRGGILSTLGTGLQNLNFDSDGNSSLDSYSWIFTTTADSCTLTGIESSPVSMQFSALNQNKTVVGRALSDQQCGPNKYIDARAFDWKWEDTNSGLIATVSNNDVNNDGRFDPRQTVTSQATGNTQVIGRVNAFNATTTVSVVPGLGDSCDANPDPLICTDNGNCTQFNLVCDPDANCTCQLPPHVDDSCDDNPDPLICAVNNYCDQFSLYCDPVVCTCQLPPVINTPPVIISTVPTNGQTNVCRNSMVEVVFDQKMNTTSIVKDSSFIVYNTDRDYNQEGSLNFYTLANLVGGCSNPQGCTVVRFFPSLPYQPGTPYIVTITSAVKSTKGVNMTSDYVFNFTPGNLDLICKLSYVDIQPTYHLFTQTGEMLDYVATPRAANNQAIAPLPGFYDWSWSWEEDDPDNIINITNNILPSIVTATANPVNGQAELTATAEITAADVSVKDTIGRQISDTADAETFICEYPWPEIPPMQDANGLEMKYCRGNDPNNLFGLLSDPATSQVTYNTDPDLVMEYLFNYLPDSLPTEPPEINPFLINKLEKSNWGKWLANLWHRWQGIFNVNSKATAQTIEDVIGLRIYKNDDMLGPRAWYESKSFPKGNPQNITVDGFPAIKDGTSIYILGPFRQGTNIVARIYVLSYNDLSSLENKGIFDQLIKNIHFFTLTTAEKSKVARDFERIADASYVAGRVEAYKNQTGSYPNLAAGSFITGLSTSKWPSWQATLGNQLGASLPTDPINKFTSYCSNDPTTHCWQDADCGSGNQCLSGCDTGADPETCWNEVTQNFSCPLGSSIYAYRLYGADDFRIGIYLEEGNYNLPANIETGSNWCDGQVYNSQGFCGDGIVQPSLGEECEIGEQMLNCPNNWANWYDPQYADCVEIGPNACNWPQVLQANDCGGYCGDGLLQSNFGEVCDGLAGLENLGQATCATDCSHPYCNPGYMLVNGVCVTSSQSNVTITSPASGTTGSNLVTVSYDNNQTGTIEYVVDNTVISTVASQSAGTHTYTFNNLTVGDHNLEIRLIVNAITVADNILYTATNQSLPPQVSILQPVNNSSNGTNITVIYVINPGGVITHLVDGVAVYTTGDNAGTYNYTFSNLSLGQHTLAVALQINNQSATSSITYNATYNGGGNNPPTAPNGLTALYQEPPTTPKHIHLNWVDTSDNETQFIIQRSVNNTTSWADYATVNANINIYDDFTVSTGNTYYYRVRAENTYGVSAYTNTASAPGGMLATIFVSSAYHNGNFNTWATSFSSTPNCTQATSTQDKANCICTHLANASSRMQDGEYRAWISANSGGSPTCSYTANNNFVGAQTMSLRKTDGTLVANSWNGLAASTILSSINRTETNAVIGSSSVAPFAWTDTNTSGNCHTGICGAGGCGTYSCNTWSDAISVPTNGAWGVPYASNQTWVYNWGIYSQPCANNGRLYCVYYDNSIPSSYGGINPIEQ